MNDSSLIFRNLGGKAGSSSHVGLSTTLYQTADIISKRIARTRLEAPSDRSSQGTHLTE